MNVYIGVISLICCTFLGYRLSVKYTERKNFFYDLYGFNEKMIGEMSFGRKTLKKIAENEKENGVMIGNILYDKILYGKTHYPAYINKEEAAVLDDYFNTLGRSDGESQLKFLSVQRKIFDEKRIETETQEKKYKKLYIKLGFLSGLIILVALL